MCEVLFDLEETRDSPVDSTRWVGRRAKDASGLRGGLSGARLVAACGRASCRAGGVGRLDQSKRELSPMWPDSSVTLTPSFPSCRQCLLPAVLSRGRQPP